MLLQNQSLFLYGFIFILISCHAPQQAVHSSAVNYKIQAGAQQPVDSAMYSFILPYKQQLDDQMNKVLGEAGVKLEKKTPEGSLGNFVADVCLWGAASRQSIHPDFCVLNNGGVRINSIEKGPITLGKMYELMPFENKIVLVEIKGTQLPDLFAWILKFGGTPVSKLAIQYNHGRVTTCSINKEPFDTTKTYWLATTDFIANGGDGFVFGLQGKRIETNLKLRDALIEYVKKVKVVYADEEGRVKIN